MSRRRFREVFLALTVRHVQIVAMRSAALAGARRAGPGAAPEEAQQRLA
jgi:hypothetical protein